MVPYFAVAERAKKRGELASGTDVSEFVASIVAPFFYRRWFTRQPLDDAFVKGVELCLKPRLWGAVEGDEQSNELRRRNTTPIPRVMRRTQKRSVDKKHTPDVARVDAGNAAMLCERGEVEHAGVDASAGKDRGREAL
jgi:hypothetical protein